MNSYEISLWRRACFLRSALCSSSLAIVLLAGCANPDRSALSSRQTPSSDLADAKAIDPGVRERIPYSLGRDADEQTLRDTLKQQPNNVDAAISLARVLLARKSPDQALEVLDNVLLAAPGDLRTLNAKGVVLDQKGRHQEAQGLYRKALEREPSNAMLHNNLKLSLALESKTETEDAGSQPRMDDALARSEQ
ncbi:tetratricopeptide (TPR) repeat protein [Bradyrhizobium japonicum]|jgi:tetratricopeptide (TPR) repeat protein|uniref:Tetratricopeptide (TPR) repeat protein n=1 Tax=Bradyrhizobium elkanii TaxID=29448 RepID=C4PL77_BRAEL|nr:tetratricopeptide repeat protein [Bradyrhizobium elkanii]MCA1398109.1 tetratricopeptide repeat protein [Bradyrhizobium sp. BRP56]MCS4007475.1 tetratricopeptide (TPR) repeat protein [Bradyrhizobium elkanii USDA 61]QOZ15396.1 hypothetical protein XI02_10495 [Bradyrhizobium sp. CCBAU 21365]UQD80077.1 tetratricopeptide repeat protein [Bradyrhizobium elkanii USDA 76]MDH6694219.1 tetratricopeptide (TPR) repeat protein [Bradyrhizobium elkanii]